MKGKKILIISYYWPPAGGTGVYRILKFTKFLERMGYQLLVLTPKKRDAPFQDDRLLQQVPESVQVFESGIMEPTTFFRKRIASKKDRTLTTQVFQRSDLSPMARLARWIRLNMFIPDAKMGWIPFAVKKGKQIIKKEQPDYILTTAPPMSTHLIGRKLARWSGIKWLADFRDPWTNIYYYHFINRMKSVDKKIFRQEESVLRDCDAFTVVNDGFFPHLDYGSKQTVIPNGFDPDEFEVPDSKTKNDKFTIRYFGGWKVNQQPDAFFEALNNLKSEDSIKGKMHVETFGFIHNDIEDRLKKLNPEITTHHNGYIGRNELIHQMFQTDLNLMIIGIGGNKEVFSTKLFEYIRIGNPVLGFGATDGAAARVLNETNAGRFFAYEDIEGTTSYIRDKFSKWEAGNGRPDINAEAVDQFNFVNLTNRLADTLENL